MHSGLRDSIHEIGEGNILIHLATLKQYASWDRARLSEGSRIAEENPRQIPTGRIMLRALAAGGHDLRIVGQKFIAHRDRLVFSAPHDLVGCRQNQCPASTSRWTM